MNRPLAEIERTNRRLADSPWGPPQPPRGAHASQWRAVDPARHFPIEPPAVTRRAVTRWTIASYVAIAAAFVWLLWP